jgi:hypothetical protein
MRISCAAIWLSCCPASLAMVMHFIDAGTAQRVTRELVDWLAPGSYLVISTASGEGAVASDMQSEYTASSTWNHSREVIRSFFAGTELMAPGLADAGEWLPGAAATTPTPKSIRVIAGIGRVNEHAGRQVCKPASVDPSARAEGD